MTGLNDFSISGRQGMPIGQVCDADVFTVDLLSGPVHCTTLEETVAVKTANDILTNRHPTAPPAATDGMTKPNG
jgi:hypothetical protein